VVLPSDRDPVRPHDVTHAAESVTQAFAPAVGMEWSVPAGGLEWSVEQTIAHMLAPAKYALYLASGSTRFIAAGLKPWSDATRAERLDALVGVARALAGVAAASPPAARGFHALGMVDAEGFVALGCLELLVHGYDVARGLGLAYEPPDGLCARVLARLFPWVDHPAGPAWTALLQATGRAGATTERDVWMPHPAPLDEWDGSIPVPDPRPVIEWVQQDPGRWQPRYQS
jgi:hypothetical protein